MCVDLRSPVELKRNPQKNLWSGASPCMKLINYAIMYLVVIPNEPPSAEKNTSAMDTPKLDYNSEALVAGASTLSCP